MSRERPDKSGKIARSLVLHDQGLDRGQIAERLGVRPGHVNGMLQRARQHRDAEKLAREVAAIVEELAS